MIRPVLAVDVDGVLADLASKVCERLNTPAANTDGKARIMGWTPENFKHYNFQANGMSGLESAIVTDLAREPGLCKSLSWYDGARLFLAQLHEIGDVFAVTAPWHAPTWDSERRDWLADEMPRANVISVPAMAKPWACAAADVLIEDNAETVSAWLDRTDTGIAILIDRAWNRHFTTTARYCHRATSFGEAVSLIRKHM